MTNSVLILIVLAAVTSTVFAAGEKRPLAKPKLSLCRNRPEHLKFGSHRYALSWLLTKTEHAASAYGGRVDWLTARNFCRERCMDAVAIETFAEWKLLVNAIQQNPPKFELDEDEAEPETKEDKVPAIWTSGRLCDFSGCENVEYVKPVNINGWFWSSNNERLSPTNCVRGNGNCFHGWSETGKFGYPQPDNRELREDGLIGNESCLSILVNPYDDGIKWHDRACYHRSLFICEDSDSLIGYINKKFKKANIPQ